MVKKCREIWNKIKYLIEQKEKDEDYGNSKYIRIKINSKYDLSLNRPLLM